MVSWSLIVWPLILGAKILAVGRSRESAIARGLGYYYLLNGTECFPYTITNSIGKAFSSIQYMAVVESLAASRARPVVGRFHCIVIQKP